MKRKILKPFVLPTLYVLSVTLILLGTYLSSRKLINNDKNSEDNIIYVSHIIINSEIPVISTDDVIKKPYTNESVKIGRSYYDFAGAEEDQVKAIIYYEGTYMPNSGVDYTLKDKFTINSILAGTVVNVKEDELLGKTVEIKHGNNIVSIYQGLSEISVKKNDVVSQGQQIGVSGTNKLNASLGNHLHFELYYQGQVVNPESYYNKLLKDL